MAGAGPQVSAQVQPDRTRQKGRKLCPHVPPVLGRCPPGNNAILPKQDASTILQLLAPTSIYISFATQYSSLFFHQIHNQFPSAFEFNQFYLRYLAYHHVSCRFNTFTFDNERLRLSSGYNYESAQTSERGSGMTGLETRTPAGQDNSDDEGSTAVSSAALGKCFIHYRGCRVSDQAKLKNRV